ncbi:MAG: ankyrin repeat domain-containing protein [Candidatus Paceibacterota bacterium]
MDSSINFTRYFLDAVSYGDEKAMRFFIKKGADIKGVKDGGTTGLMLAAEKGHLGIVKIFLNEYSVNVDQKDKKRGNTALIYAIRRSGSTPVPCTKKLLEKYIKIIELLLDYGADVNVKNKYGKTPLMYACEDEYGLRWHIVDILNNNGANLGTKDTWGKKALDYARENPGIVGIKVSAI